MSGQAGYVTDDTNAQVKADQRDVTLGGASSECKDISLHARIEKLDLEHSIRNGSGLPDELVEPQLRRRAVALLVDVGAVGAPRRAAVEEHSETY